MSLLDGGPDTLQVWPERIMSDSAGNTVRAADRSGPPIVIRGRVQPVSSDETAADGQDVSSLYQFRGRVFPGGPWAAVDFDGRTWDVVGEPAVRRGSPRTEHVTVLLKARSPLPAST